MKDLNKIKNDDIALYLLVLLAALALSGCATTGTGSTVPKHLLTCTPQPPAPKGATQRDVGLYVVDLAAAGDDCRTKLRSVDRILNPETK